MKLGLKDPVPGAVKLRLASYLNWRVLPTPPDHFGHTSLVQSWGMLGNDDYGDCAIAGPCHQIMLATAEAGAAAQFDTKSALQNYSAITGFDPNDPSTDQGTAIDDMARYWRHHGLVDANGTAHKITAYLDLTPGDTRELWLAAWLLPLGVGCGYDLPQSAVDQAQNGQIWDVVKGSPIVGGHYVPTLARPSSGMGLGISWGNPVPFTVRFYQTFNNQGLVALSKEGFVKAKTLEGFDYETLADDLKQISRQ